MRLSDPILRPPDSWTEKDWRAISYNLNITDRMFVFLKGFNNPCGWCGFPLPLTANLRVEVWDSIRGLNVHKDVCSLCYDMHRAVDSPYWVDIQRKWVGEQQKKKRLSDEKGGIL